MLATAADLPPELFDLILDYFTSAESIILSPEERGIKKQSLGRCSLTCRFWASRCRPRIFMFTTLRCLEDFQTLSTFPEVVRFWITDLKLEDTEGLTPWTHMVYTFVSQGGLSRQINIEHSLSGACTSTSVQTIRSLHNSLPYQQPDHIKDCYPITIQNFRLRSFADIIELVRKLWGRMYWQLQWENISWIACPSGVPPVLGAKNRGICNYAVMKNCMERWPFLWILISTRQPSPSSKGRPVPSPFLHPSEALRLAELIKCITSLTGPKARLCAHTEFSRNGPTDGTHNKFSLILQCREKFNCTPISKLACQDGSLKRIRLDFNTDPDGGCLPFDFDWVRFDEVCSQCQALEMVELRVDGTATEVAEFGQGMRKRMKSLARTNKLRFPYYDTEEDKNKTWVDPTGLEGEQPADVAQVAA